jgi:adenylate cyclase
MLDLVQTPPRPTAEADGQEVCGLPFGLIAPALALRDWLLVEAVQLEDPGEVLVGLAERLNALNVPVDRITTAIEALHSEYSGIGRIWTREDGPSVRLFPHQETESRIYLDSPFAEVHRTRQWLVLDLDETPDEAYNIVPDLKEAGYRHYVVVPIFFTNGTENGMSFATRTEKGFGDRCIAILRFIMPAVAAGMEVRALNARLDGVLRIYVGDEPHRAILSGTIRRGQVTRIRSAILFADMRSYTRLSSSLDPEGAVDLLNLFFDCLVPPIEEQDGEVLKYLGDGLLAIFRDRGDDTGGAAQSALTAAHRALKRLDAANAEGRFPARIEAGIALHHGEAAYGARLDFTVIGRDVNVASRIAELNKTLGERLLLSGSFAHHLWGDPKFLGRYQVDGIDDPIAVYRP